MRTGEHLPPPTIEQRVAVCKKHFDESIKWKGEHLGIVEMRKHYGNYFRGIPHFKPHRMVLVQSMDIQEILATLNEVELKFKDLEQLDPVGQ